MRVPLPSFVPRDGAAAMSLAWRAVPRLPRPLVAAGFAAGAAGAWAAGGAGVRRYESNVRRILPGLEAWRLNLIALEGMCAYMRTYRETFQLAAMSGREIEARVRLVGAEPVAADLARGVNPVLALGHMGNWDLAGTFAARRIAPVTTVAERLEPPEVFADYCRMRESHGMTVVPADRGQAFRGLLRAARDPAPKLIPILADRDVSSGGIEVPLAGRPARVGPGPAALAVATGAPLYFVAMWAERLHGARRRAARSGWGYVLRFCPPVRPDPARGRRAEVRRLTAAWVDQLGTAVRAHPADWHMLQPVFAEDFPADVGPSVRSGRKGPASDTEGGRR